MSSGESTLLFAGRGKAGGRRDGVASAAPELIPPWLELTELAWPAATRAPSRLRPAEGERGLGIRFSGLRAAANSRERRFTLPTSSGGLMRCMRGEDPPRGKQGSGDHERSRMMGLGFVTAGSRIVAVGELGLGTMTLTARPTKTRRGDPLGPPPLTSAILELTCCIWCCSFSCAERTSSNCLSRLSACALYCWAAAGRPVISP